MTNRRAPKYRLICDALKTELADGKYGSRKVLPSEVSLSRRFKTGRSTVKRALECLRGEGLIRSQQGRGTFVTRLGASRKIGLIVPGMGGSEFFPAMVSEIARVIRERGYMILMADFSKERDETLVRDVKAFARSLIDENVQGVIYQPLEFVKSAADRNREIVDIFTSAGVPVVLMINDLDVPPHRSSFDLVGINNAKAGRRLAEHLMSVGARNVHLVLRPNSGSAHADRLAGLMQALAFAGGGRRRYGVLVADPGDVGALRRHLRKGRCPDAFICGSDTQAGVFRQTLEKVGLRVGRDVLLAGFNDLQIAKMLTPPLTTVRQPCADIAKAVFDTLMARVTNPDRPPQEVLLDAPLIVRESTQWTERRSR